MSLSALHCPRVVSRGIWEMIYTEEYGPWIGGEGWTMSPRTHSFYRTDSQGLITGSPMFRTAGRFGRPWWKSTDDDKALHSYAAQFALEGPQ